MAEGEAFSYSYDLFHKLQCYMYVYCWLKSVDPTFMRSYILFPLMNDSIVSHPARHIIAYVGGNTLI